MTTGRPPLYTPPARASSPARQHRRNLTSESVGSFASDGSIEVTPSHSTPPRDEQTDVWFMPEVNHFTPPPKVRTASEVQMEEQSVERQLSSANGFHNDSTAWSAKDAPSLQQPGTYETDTLSAPTFDSCDMAARVPPSLPIQPNKEDTVASERRSKRWWLLLGAGLLLLIAAIIGIAMGVSSGGSSSLSASTGDAVPTLAPSALTASSVPTQAPTLAPPVTCANGAIGPLVINGPPRMNNLTASLVSERTVQCGVSTQPGLWYSLTGGDEVIRPDVCGSNVTVQVNVYESNCEKCIASSLDYCAVSFFARKGLDYYLHVTSQEPALVQLAVAYETNGLCSTKTPLPINVKTAGSLRGASDNAQLSCSGLVTLQQVYYTIQGTGNLLKASTCNPLTNFGARVNIIGDTCSGCVAYSDSKCGTGYQNLWQSQIGVNYTLLVFSTNQIGGTLFDISVADNVSVISNDNCVAAQTISPTGMTISGSTLNATSESQRFPRDCSGLISQPGVWYKVNGTGGTLLASTCNDATDYSTRITILTGNCTSFSCVTTQTQFCGDQASVYWNTSSGQEYYIFVNGQESDAAAQVGNFALTVGPFVPEANDQCANAVIADPTTVGDTLYGSNFDATMDLNAPSCDGVPSEAPGVWYTVTPTTSGPLRASTCDPSTTFDTQITVYRGTCGSLICVTSNDNSCGFQSTVVWSASAGVTYYIMVHGRSVSSVGDFALVVEPYTPAVSNDFCADAMEAVVGGGVIEGSTTTATFDNAASCTVPNTAPGVWYFVNGTGTELVASLCNSATNYDTAISIFTGDCLSLNCIAGNDNGCGRQSVVSWVSKVRNSYYILVHGYSVRTGDFGLTIEEVASAIPNDYCVRAEPLQLSDTPINATLSEATVDDVPICSNIESNGVGVWYTVVGTGNKIEATTCGSSSSSDTRISVYGGICGNLTCIGADSNACGLHARVIWDSIQGETYRILVHNGSTKPPGDFILKVHEFVSDQPNDECTNAITVRPDGTIYYGATTGSSFDNVGFCGTLDTGPGVWYIVLGTGDRFVADTCDDYTNFDTKISVFTGTCDSLQCVDGNDDGGCGLKSSVSFDTQAFQVYRILIHGFGTNRVGQFGFRVSGSLFL